MAEKNKKVVLKVGLDATGAKKAISELGRDIAKSTRELRNIDKALKLNPENATLLTQRTRALQEILAKTHEKSTKLKQALDNLKAAGVDETSADFRKLQREIIETEAQTKKLSLSLNSLSTANAAWTEKLSNVGDKIKSIADKTKLISLSAGAATASIFALAKKSGAAADDLNTLSKVTGISTEELQRMAFASDLVDVKVDDVARGMSKLIKNVGEAEKGSKNVTKAFRELGVSWKNTNGSLKNGKQIFDEVIDALHNVKDETKRNALAMDLMGKSAMTLNPLILDGSKAFREVAENAKGIITQEQLDKANQFNDSLDLIKAQAKQTGLQLGAMFADDFKDAAKFAQQQISNIASYAENLGPSARKGIATATVAFSTLSPTLNLLGTSLKNVEAISKATSASFSFFKKGGHFIFETGKHIPELILKLKNLSINSKATSAAMALFSKGSAWFSGLSAVLPVVATKFGAVAVAAKSMWLAVTGPIGLVVAGVAAIGAAIAILYKKCKWFRDGINSIFGGIIRFAKKVADTIGKLWSGVKNFFRGASNATINYNAANSTNYIPRVPHLSVGTDFVQKSGLAVIHRGEAVVTRESNSKFDVLANMLEKMPSNMNNGKIELVVNLDGETIARKTHKFISEFQANDLRKARL